MKCSTRTSGAPLSHSRGLRSRSSRAPWRATRRSRAIRACDHDTGRPAPPAPAKFRLVADEVAVLLSTTSTMEEAERLARGLVERRLAACVNVLPGVRSFYRWQGRIESDPELLLLIKTTRDRVEALEAALADLHSYDLPELVRLDVAGGSRAYLDWVRTEASVADDEP